MKHEELAKLIKEVFSHYGKKELSEEEFIQYFQEKGLSKDEIEKLWSEAHSQELISVGVWSISDPNNPLKIIEQKIVFTLLNEEEREVLRKAEEMIKELEKEEPDIEELEKSE